MDRPSNRELLFTPGPDDLRVQAELLEPEAAVLLQMMGVEAGWRCVDVGCGSAGILRSLSKRVGPAGRVVGLDSAAEQLAAARALVQAEGLENVELVQGDAFAAGLPRGGFDLVHARYLFFPVPAVQHDALFRELVALVRPGGVVAVQEPDGDAGRVYPDTPAFRKVREAQYELTRRRVGEEPTGPSIYQRLVQAGFTEVRARTFDVVIPYGHPWRAPLGERRQAMVERLAQSGLVTAQEAEEGLADRDRLFADPATYFRRGAVTQVWGRKPG